MSTVARTVAFLTQSLFWVASAYGQGRLEEHGREQRFISEKYGFSMEVPHRWLVDPSTDTPIFFSFSPSLAGNFNQQLKLPKGGAVISVVAQEDTPGQRFTDLWAWATADARADSVQNPSIEFLQVPPTTGISKAVISSYDVPAFGPDDRAEHRVNIYWEFQHRQFVAHLMYLAKDSKGTDFDRILMDAVRGIRPTTTKKRKMKA
jgi:hypothetical protein